MSHGQRAARSGGRMALAMVVVLVIRSRRLTGFQKPAVEVPSRLVLIFVSFAGKSHHFECDPSRSLKFPFKSTLTTSVRTALHFIEVNGSALLQRGMFNQERISRPVPAFHFVAITEFPFFSKSQCAFHPHKCLQSIQTKTSTHPSELNDSIKPWLGASASSFLSSSSSISWRLSAIEGSVSCTYGYYNYVHRTLEYVFSSPVHLWPLVNVPPSMGRNRQRTGIGAGGALSAVGGVVLSRPQLDHCKSAYQHTINQLISSQHQGADSPRCVGDERSSIVFWSKALALVHLLGNLRYLHNSAETAWHTAGGILDSEPPINAGLPLQALCSRVVLEY
ncbi:hypothetical protein B0H13DRAFT_2278780 [Mycena leptocephala]|nr:hypothetical protein B0H13DRAFT_2278780 [Mycena leptocephala]